jgi:sugar phosphate isomerase/epimerase
LPTIARRYRKLLELGAETGVTPQLELWGFSKTLSKLGEMAYVATEAGHPDACVLPDFYHIYKGGSDFAGLKMIEASRMHVFHMNDYPDMPRETIGDERAMEFAICRRSLAILLRMVLQAAFRWNCSTATIGSRMRWRLRKLVLRK